MLESEACMCMNCKTHVRVLRAAQHLSQAQNLHIKEAFQIQGFKNVLGFVVVFCALSEKCSRRNHIS
jgi:hypothetical protein